MIITDYQFEQDIYSDSKFIQDYIGEIESQEKPVTVVADGAYSGFECETTAADFKFNNDGTRDTEYSNGKLPKSCCCTKAGMCIASFRKEEYENYPFRNRFNPKEYARTTRVSIFVRTQRHTMKQRERKTDEFKKMSAFRNGVETVSPPLEIFSEQTKCQHEENRE